MPRIKKISVIDFSKITGIDADELLLALWELGIEDITRHSDLLSSKYQSLLYKKFDLPSPKNINTLKYWAEYYGIPVEELIHFCNSNNFIIDTNKKTLTKNEIKRIGSITRPTPKPPAQVAYSEPFSIKKKLKKLDWSILGHKKKLRCLKYEDVENIHFALVDDYKNNTNPIDPPGIRDKNNLASAIFRQHTSNYDEIKYPTVEMCGAALLHSLVLNHPFHNGNKRTALVSLLVFLNQNGFVLICDEDELFKFVIKLAQHSITEQEWDMQADREVQKITRWIMDNSRALEHGDHPLPFHKLRKILSAYNCDISTVGGSSSKVNIERNVTKKSLLGRRTPVKLKTQIVYSGEGEEIELDTIKMIRQLLHLDDDNGVDSRAFYDKAPTTFNEWIARYKNTLDRLAKL